MPSTLELRATNGELVLGGTLHLPAGEPRATVLMVPGSGPSDRDNDVYFPAIRAGLLERGIAAASFDKRGVGESTGDWRDTGPAEQAADVAAQLASLRESPGIDPTRLGLFGHSQGGWVVLEVAAADPSVAFVITNSGPGVTMARQERFATEAHMTAGGAPADAVAGALATQDALVALVRSGADLATVQATAGEDGQGPSDPRSSSSSAAGSTTIPAPLSNGSRARSSRSSATRISSRRWRRASPSSVRHARVARETWTS